MYENFDENWHSKNMFDLLQRWHQMSSGVFDTIHVLVWITAYSMVGLALILSFISVRVGHDSFLAVRSFVLREAYFVLVISSTYLMLALSPEIESVSFYSAVANGAAIHGLWLLTYAFPSLFHALAVAVATGVKTKPNNRLYRLLILRPGCGLAFVVGVAFGLFSYLAREYDRDFYGFICKFVFFLTIFVTVLSFTISFFYFLNRLFRQHESFHVFSALFALLLLLLFSASALFEFAPQLTVAHPVSMVRYYLLASFFIILNAILSILLFRRISIDSIPQSGGRGDTENGILSGGLLSNREMEVALLLSEGKSYKHIASELYISLSTVRTHVERIYHKLGVGNKVELANKLRASKIG